MGLVNAATFIGYCSTFRVVHIGGRYGGGKTSLAWRIAYELVERGLARYVISNVKSVWADDPAKITLRQGVYVDAVVILDEGGIFLKTGYDADKFLAFLRKLNITLLIPSVLPPATKARFLSVQRVFNAGVLGLPLWWYRVDLVYGPTREKDYFGWWNPSEVYGIYDTLGFPADDGGLSEYVGKWTAAAAGAAGYEAKRSSVVTYENDSSSQSRATSSGSTGDDSDSVLETLRRVAQGIEESSAASADAVSVLLDQGNKKRRR